MGMFGKSKKDYSGAYSHLEPVAIPVATPVPEIQAQQEAYFAANGSGNNVQYQSNGGKKMKGKSTVAPIPIATPETTYPKVANSQKMGLVGLSDPTLERNPMMMRQCPSCQQESRTRIKTSPTWQTWTASGVLLIIFWPVCWIPLILDNCKQTDHYCVLCGVQVGQVAAFQDCCVTQAT